MSRQGNMTQPSRKYVGGETIFYSSCNLPQLLVTTMISDLEIDLLVFILGFIHQRSTPRGVPMRLLRLPAWILSWHNTSALCQRSPTLRVRPSRLNVFAGNQHFCVKWSVWPLDYYICHRYHFQNH